MINNSAAESINLVTSLRRYLLKNLAHTGCPSDVLIPDHIHPCHSQTATENFNLQFWSLSFSQNDCHETIPECCSHYSCLHPLSFYLTLSSHIIPNTFLHMFQPASTHFFTSFPQAPFFLYGRYQILKLLSLLYGYLHFQPLLFWSYQNSTVTTPTICLLSFSSPICSQSFKLLAHFRLLPSSPLPATHPSHLYLSDSPTCLTCCTEGDRSLRGLCAQDILWQNWQQRLINEHEVPASIRLVYYAEVL